MSKRRNIDGTAAVGKGGFIPSEPPIQDDSNDVFVFPTSFAQQRLWFLNQLDPDNPSYNIPVAFRLKGRLKVKTLEQALNDLARRHEILRTTFSAADGEPVQVVAAGQSVSMSVVDMRGYPDAAREGDLQKRINVEVRQPFDLSTGPLWRIVLLHTGEEDHVLLIVLHHIISDGWSMGILFRELSALYEAAVAGVASSLPELPVQYADYAVWQREWLQGDTLDRQLDYWKERLADAPRVLEMPTDHHRPAVSTHEGTRQSVCVAEDCVEALRTFSRQENGTLFMTFLAAFAVLLDRYTGQDDIVIGTPVANRSRPEIEGLIGFFVNTLGLRVDLAGNPGFRNFLARVRTACLEAYDHQDLPFEKLVEELKPERQLNQSPIFQVMFAFENEPHHVPVFSGLEVSPLDCERGTAKFDLSLSVVETTEGARVTIEYKTGLFESDTITRMLGQYRTLLEGIAADPDQPLGTLPLLTKEEQHRLLVEWNDTEAEFPRDRCVHQLFEAQVEKTPDAVAIVFENQRLTYRELNLLANKLARDLMDRGVGPEVLVGLCLERSPQMIVAILSIFKAGGAYVPMDPTYPRERLAQMLANSRLALLLTSHHLLERLPEHHVQTFCLDTDYNETTDEAVKNPVNRATAENLAYIIFTSGSTGAPKGVMIEHRGVCNVSLASIQNFGLQAGNSIMLQHGSLAFDNSVWEIFMVLLSGATMCLAGPDALAGAGLGRLLRERAVTHAIFVPSVLATVPEGEYPALRTLLVGAERCPPELVDRWSPGRRFFNTYGPTEASIHVALCEYKKTYQYGFPIGRPIHNTQLYILDRHLQPVPIGVPGELHIGGVGLARGYLDQPELTTETFIPDTFSDEPGARLYKTGDLVRYLPDGNIEFLGRIDQQVKIRGFRIEPGEVESALRQHPAVREAVVTAREYGAGDNRLVAYIVFKKNQAQALGQMRSFLGERLPEYMVPSVCVPLECLPLTPTRKIDRRALPAPETIRPELAEAYVAPRTDMEEILCGIWSEVLGIRKIGVHDDFFDLGGHSLLAIRIVSRIHRIFLQDVSLRSFFEAPTVSEIAAAIDKMKKRGA